MPSENIDDVLPLDLTLLYHAQLLTHLSTHWSASLKARIALGVAASPEAAELVCCVPESEQSAAKVVPVTIEPTTGRRRTLPAAPFHRRDAILQGRNASSSRSSATP